MGVFFLSALTLLVIPSSFSLVLYNIYTLIISKFKYSAWISPLKYCLRITLPLHIFTCMPERNLTISSKCSPSQVYVQLYKWISVSSTIFFLSHHTDNQLTSFTESIFKINPKSNNLSSLFLLLCALHHQYLLPEWLQKAYLVLFLLSCLLKYILNVVDRVVLFKHARSCCFSA